MAYRLGRLLAIAVEDAVVVTAEDEAEALLVLQSK